METQEIEQVEGHWRLTREAKEILKRQAKRNGLSQSGFVETLLRRYEEDYRKIVHLEANDKALAMFAERNENDR
jgi:hypothetical protein